MRYTTYEEDLKMVKKDKYEQIKEVLLEEHPKVKPEFYTLRKLRFMQAAGERANDTIAKYYICLRNRDDNQIYIEKKYTQNNIMYKRCEKISREEADKILGQDVEWMKNHRKPLLADFYLQYSLNQLRPKHITEYAREKLELKKGCCITVAHGISRIAGGETDIFSDGVIPIQCLGEEEVSVCYKREIRLPEMLFHMMQIPEDTWNEPAFAF